MKTPLLAQHNSSQFSTARTKFSALFILPIMLLFLFLMPPFVQVSSGATALPADNSALGNLPPVAICLPAPLVIYLGQDGTAELNPSQLDGGSYDPEQGPLTFTTRSVSYTCSNIGPNEVTLIVLDNTGQSDECTTTVIIADNIPPVARCKNITVVPDEKGDYNLQVLDIEFGSTDNCKIKSMTITPSFIPCIHESAQEMVTLTVTDFSGNSGTCTSYVQFLGDSDCDGVGDLCDKCPGGNDQIDLNNDGLPDCAIFPGKANIADAWKCGNNLQKVLICHIPPGNPENRHTICVSPNAIPAHLAHGDYLGSCDEATCIRSIDNTRAPAPEFMNTMDIMMFPNPASDKVFLNFADNAGKPATLVIMNKYGLVMFSKKFALLPEGQFRIVLDNYQDGLYFVKITSDGFSTILKLQVAGY